MSERNAEHEVIELLRRLRFDLTAAQGKLSEALRALAALDLPAAGQSTCPHCGVRLRGPVSLAEHIHLSHGGPVPEAWRRAEQLAGLGESEQT